VIRFCERGDSRSAVVNGGVYLIDRHIVSNLPKSGSLEQDVFPELALLGRVCGRAYDGFFLDIGMPDEYQAAGELLSGSLKRSAFFLDQDSIMNVDHGDAGSINRFEWIEGAVESVKLANDLGYLVFLVSNQANVARGLYGGDVVREVHRSMSDTLRNHGAHIDAIEYCSYHPDDNVLRNARSSSHRNAAPITLLNIIAHWPIDLSSSVMVGDKPLDIEAGKRAGIRGILFEGGNLLNCVKHMLASVA
jgi:D-glycero-D-manno-heptose 1,7-bisphosphate phosphatase